jgi:hypothetical protein
LKKSNSWNIRVTYRRYILTGMYILQTINIGKRNGDIPILYQSFYSEIFQWIM